MENFINSVFQFVQHKSLAIVWIAVFYFVAKALLKVFIKKIIKLSDAVSARRNEKQKKRADTVTKIISDNGNMLIDIAVLIMTLALFGFDLAPILAGLGIVGLAVGFGAQSLIKDFVSGLFILIENQYNIGDKVQIGAAVGTVIKITLRSTVLEDEEKKVYYIANGSITTVTNFSQK